MDDDELLRRAIALPAVVVHGNAIPATAADAYASVLALALVAPPQSPPTPAERAVAVFLVRNAGRQPDGRTLRTDPTIDADAACIAAKSPAAQRAWLADHLAGDLRCR